MPTYEETYEAFIDITYKWPCLAQFPGLRGWVIAAYLTADKSVNTLCQFYHLFIFLS